MEFQKSSSTKITVAGRLDDPNYHRCLSIALRLVNDHLDSVQTIQVEYLPFFETQWEEFLKKKANKQKGAFYNHEESPLVYVNDKEYIGDQDKFMDYVLHTYKFKDDNDAKMYTDEATNACVKRVNESKTCKYAFMEFQCGQNRLRVVYELFSSIAPNTCENFLGLCKGFKKADCEVMTYKGTEVSRVYKGMFI